jgi:hypothetical protein
MKPGLSAQYALMAAVAAVVGLLLLRAPFTAVPLTADFFSNRYTFSYLFAAVALTFWDLATFWDASRIGCAGSRQLTASLGCPIGADSMIGCRGNGAARRGMGRRWRC